MAHKLTNASAATITTPTQNKIANASIKNVTTPNTSILIKIHKRIPKKNSSLKRNKTVSLFVDGATNNARTVMAQVLMTALLAMKRTR